VYWEGSGKISKLKKPFSTRVTILSTAHNSNNLLQPENLYTAPSTINNNSLQSGSRNGKSFSEFKARQLIS
jgi:hypothetical protein